MRALFIFLLGYAVLACVVYLRNIGRPALHRDREVAWFLVVQGWSDLTTNAVLILATLEALRGRVVVWLFAAALAVQGGVYTWRWWLSRHAPRRLSRESGKTDKTGRAGRMRFKIDPEVVRLIAMVTAFVQTVGSTLALSGAVPATVVLVFTALAAGLTAALAAYAQGQQTEPPNGMVTEEYAAKIVEPDPLPGHGPVVGRVAVASVVRDE